MRIETKSHIDHSGVKFSTMVQETARSWERLTDNSHIQLDYLACKYFREQGVPEDTLISKEIDNANYRIYYAYEGDVIAKNP